MIRLRWLAAAIIIVAGSLLLVALPARGLSWTPDLVLVAVLAIGLGQGSAGGVLAGLIAGWVVDLVPPGTGTLGASAALYAAAGALAGLAHRHGPIRYLRSTGLALVLVAVTAGLRLAFSVAGGGVPAPSQRLHQAVATVGLAAVILAPLARFLSRRAWQAR